MRRETPAQYALDLVQKNTWPKALSIAKTHKATTNMDNVSGLPEGPVYYHKPRGVGEWRLNKNHYSALHGFWTNVLGEVKKLEKRFMGKDS